MDMDQPLKLPSVGGGEIKATNLTYGSMSRKALLSGCRVSLVHIKCNFFDCTFIQGNRDDGRNFLEILSETYHFTVKRAAGFSVPTNRDRLK